MKSFLFALMAVISLSVASPSQACDRRNNNCWDGGWAAQCTTTMVQTYGEITGNFLNHCSRIKTSYAAACVSALAKQYTSLGAGMIDACATINNPYALAAAQSVIFTYTSLDAGMITAVSSATCQAHTDCVRALTRRYDGQLYATTLEACFR